MKLILWLTFTNQVMNEKGKFFIENLVFSLILNENFVHLKISK